MSGLDTPDGSTRVEAPALPLPIEWLPVDGRPEQLIVLLHGWRGEAMDLAPLAQALRLAFPQSAVLAPEAPHAGDARNGKVRGRQWYSVEGLDPATNWHQRVTGARPGIEAWLRTQQRRLGVGPAATAIGGFSQGAVIALEIALRNDGLAGRVLAFGGCFSAPPPAAPEHTTLHLFHGGADDVFPVAMARQALETIGTLQGDATLDVADGVGHELHPALIDCALHRLKSHIPLRTWRRALGAAPEVPRHDRDYAPPPGRAST
jgi:phospholipase/carboxylesterase